MRYRIHLDADLRSVLRRAARIYRNRNLMRFGLDADWTKYLHEPLRLPWRPICMCDGPLGRGEERFYEIRADVSAMQGHWE